MIHQVIQILHSILELILILFDFFIFLHVEYMLGFDKATYITLLFQFTLSIRLINSLSGSDVLLLLKFMNIVSIFVLYLY